MPTSTGQTSGRRAAGARSNGRWHALAFVGVVIWLIFANEAFALLHGDAAKLRNAKHHASRLLNTSAPELLRSSLAHLRGSSTVMSSAAQGALQRILRKGTRAAGAESVAEGPPLPLVSILSLSNGQHWCNRNIIQNACYQDFPHTHLELIIAETSPFPSPDLVQANKTSSWGCLRRTVYFWFNSSQSRGPWNPTLGALRTLLFEASRGDLVVNMDNDDFYHPSYVRFVLSAMEEFRNPAYHAFEGIATTSGIDDLLRRPSASMTGKSPVPLPPPSMRGNRMFLPGVIMTHAHMLAHVRIDGSLFLDHEQSEGRMWGSHQTAMTRAVGDLCYGRHGLHGDASLNEEKGLHDSCIRRHNVTLRRVPTAVGFYEKGKKLVPLHGPPYKSDVRGSLPRETGKESKGGSGDSSWRVVDDRTNGMLLVKFENSMGITRQQWGLDRAKYNRLTERDWRDVLAMQAWHYEQWHELTRPGHVERLPYYDPPNQAFDAAAVPATRFRRTTPHRGAPLHAGAWRDFWTRNKDLFGESRKATSDVTDVFKTMARDTSDKAWTSPESRRFAATRGTAALKAEADFYASMTCQKISDVHGTLPGNFHTAPPKLRKFWLEHKCATKPAEASGSSHNSS